MTAFSRLQQLYTQRGRRAKELREMGKKVIGYFCCFVPDEIITAFDMVPYRIQGSQSDPIDQADAFIEPMACPFARSCFNLALKGEYDFLDGFVAPHSCDTMERLYHIWRHNKPSPFNHMINVPHMMGPSSEDSTGRNWSILSRAWSNGPARNWRGQAREPSACTTNAGPS